MTGLFDELTWRGLVHQISDPAVPELLDTGGVTAYIGFDPTADSMHVGHLLQMCNLRRLREAGHRVISLAGGATGMIGDPGGKSQERNLLGPDELAHNLAGIRAQLTAFLGDDAIFVDNSDWTAKVSVLEFLRDVGKHFTINQMVAKDSVKSRIERPEQGISYTEFSYMLLQAFDFLHLFDEYGCRLQMGASDQWGNITMGVELIRKARGAEAYALTTPLVLKSDGTKFGKTETGAVWLDAARTSPYELFQFFVRADDGVVGTYLRYFTWLSRDEIDRLDKATAAHPERREAQLALAAEVTALVHGAEAAAAARDAADALFARGAVAADAPSSAVEATDLSGDGLLLIDVLAGVGLAASRSAARRDLEGGGVYVNGERQVDVDRRLISADLTDDGTIVLRRGKKRYHVLRTG